MAYQAGNVNDLGADVELLYGQFQLKLEEINDLVEGDIRRSRIAELNDNVSITSELIKSTFQSLIDALHARKNTLIKELLLVQAQKTKEFESQKSKDVKIQTKMKSIKDDLRSIVTDKSKQYDQNQKRKELQHILQNRWRKNARTSLNPCMDDPTLALVSFRGSAAPIKQAIDVFGKIDNEDEKTVDNLSKYYKLKDGTLNVTIVCAQNLTASDSNGFSDPYAVCWVDKSKKEQTKVIKKTVNPSWNETFVFKIKDAVHDMIHVTVWDKDKMSRDDQIGGVTIPVIMILKGSGFIEKNFAFTNNKWPGTIQLLLEYSEVQQDTQIID